jgi:hypothetical protein
MGLHGVSFANTEIEAIGARAARVSPAMRMSDLERKF